MHLHSHPNLLMRFTSLCLSLVLLPAASAVTAADADYKLQPLNYHQDDLIVDLGVGLWAWPMPLDYDGDGDLDLLVSCPDKPSNGVYFFENPTQDPTQKQPVFRPGVRIGKTSNNFQISHVGDDARILKPGYQFRRDATTGKFDFDSAEKIYPRTNVHGNKVRGNMWRHVDYDGDGDHDLIVGAGDWTDYGWDHAYDAQGRWRNGPLRGFVYLIHNEGDDTNPEYSESPEQLRAEGSVIDVYGWPSPNFADFDGDGDLDLLCGEFLDGFTYFQNRGTRKHPAYAAGKRLRSGDGKRLAMDLQMVTPTSVDWDADGDQDLIVGDEDGRVALVEHSGEIRDGVPVFKPPVYLRQQSDTLKFGALATPYAYDWDGDGDEDILCGNTAGYIGLFKNLGLTADGTPKWSAAELLETNGRPFRVLAGSDGSIQGPCEAKWGYTTLSVADWDGDQDPDIIYNSIWSKVGILQNDSGELTDRVPERDLNELPPKWYWWQTQSDANLTQWRTTPVALDFDADQSLDLVMLDQEGFLTLRRDCGEAERVFIDEQNQPLRLNAKTAGGSGRIKIAVVDWDGDGRLDVLTNSENATWYRNCEDRDGKHVLKRIGNLAKRNVAGHTSSPAVCDFDADGKPDLLVGSENGRIYYIRHDECNVFTDEEIRARPADVSAEPKFPGFVREDFVFTKSSFPQCHASTICETSRGLVVAWFGGTKEKAKDVGIWTSYHDGNRWSSPKEWANGIQHDGLRHPCWNPVLHQGPGDSPTLLFFKTGPDPKTWWGEMMVSDDRGRSFSRRRRLPEGIDGPVRCKPIMLADGSLLSGSSTEYDGWRVHFENTAMLDGIPDGTWQRIGPIGTVATENSGAPYNAIQPTLLQHSDGRIQAMCRTKEGVVVTTFSADDGLTWSDLAATNLPNPNSGIDVVTLQDGRFLLIYNHLDAGQSGWGRRGLLNLAISDNGLQWRKVGVLEREEKSEFSYPAIIQADDGIVHLSYTWKRSRIKHVVIDPAKIVAGESLSVDAWDAAK